MPPKKQKSRLFKASEFPSSDKPFPIVEVFGHHRELRTPEAREAFDAAHCPFSGTPCEKFRQYGYGYCSVSYRTDWDDEYQTYAVCDHRLDGAPIRSAVTDFFGEKNAPNIALVPEVVLQKPRQSFDYVALDKTSGSFIGIETQAIDLRGGGVGPAWAAILAGKPKSWREHYSKEAAAKGRKDTVAYGVNTANIYKRLGLQIAQKGAIMNALGAKLYVICQQRPFNYLASRVEIDWSSKSEEWDICFLTFDYTGKVLKDSKFDFIRTGIYRVSVKEFAKGLISPPGHISKESFLKAVRKKAGL